MLAFMKGASRLEIEQFADAFWEEFLPNNQNEPVVKKLYWHHKQGHKVYIVTASFDLYTNHLKKIWPINGIISTKAQWEGDILTGKILGKNCKGNEKPLRISKELNKNLENIVYYAYTDSYSDLPLLEHATYPVLVESKKLKILKPHQIFSNK